MIKPLAAPSALKNTYFWIAAILVVVACFGILKGQEAIRDPGQRDENQLVLIYFGAAIVMLVNGWISHTAYVRQYKDLNEDPELGRAETSLTQEIKKADKASAENTNGDNSPS